MLHRTHIPGIIARACARTTWDGRMSRTLLVATLTASPIVASPGELPTSPVRDRLRAVSRPRAPLARVCGEANE